MNPFLILILILRAKTIFYERIEAKGLKSSPKSKYGFEELIANDKSDGLNIGESKLSVSRNYLACLSEEFKNLP